MSALGQVGREYHPAQEIPLLDGRVVIGLPRGAAAVPRDSSIMGTARSAEVETRALFDAGGERFVVFATELFGYSEDLLGDVGRVVSGWRLPPGQRAYLLDTPPQRPGGLSVAAYGFDRLDGSRQAVPIADSFVRTADAAVLRLQLYVSPNALGDPQGLTALAVGALGTLTPGPRQVDAGGGVRTLADLGGEPRVVVDVPKGWVAYHEQGLSFVVMRLTRMMPFGGPSHASVTIYRGGHPSLRHSDAAAKQVTHVDGTLLGVPTRWHSLREETGSERSVFVREALVPDDGRQVHVMAETDDVTLNGEIDAILASIAPADKP
jgi:hypothetical protein